MTAGSSSSSWRLDLVSNAIDGQPMSIPLPSGTTCVGREHGDVLLRSPHISTRHAKITVINTGSVILSDISTNGCQIFRGPSTEILKKSSSLLAEGDVVMFGLSAGKAADGKEYRYRLTTAHMGALPESPAAVATVLNFPAKIMTTHSEDSSQSCVVHEAQQHASLNEDGPVAMHDVNGEAHAIVNIPIYAHDDGAKELTRKVTQKSDPGRDRPASPGRQTTNDSRRENGDSKRIDYVQPTLLPKLFDGSFLAEDGALSHPTQLIASEAASEIGYEEIDRTFIQRTDGSRTPLEFRLDEILPKDVRLLDYACLRAVRTTDRHGWGLACTKSIACGTFVVEMCGRVISEEECTAPGFDTTYVVGFDDETLSKKRVAGDEVRYIDCRKHGNVTLANEEPTCTSHPLPTQVQSCSLASLFFCSLLVWPTIRRSPISRCAIFLVLRRLEALCRAELFWWH